MDENHKYDEKTFKLIESFFYYDKCEVQGEML